MKTFFFLLLSSLIFSTAFSHSGKAKFHVIIDTDGTPDDFRSLAILLSSPVFETIAVTCKDALEYWAALRAMALIYWRDWDRHNMFLIELI